jgi:conjugal transfer/type IV secretion protein DotA/TraY
LVEQKHGKNMTGVSLMMFLGKKPAPPPGARPEDGVKPKPRVTIGSLFNPDLGASIRPMRESARIFVQLIAMVFAAHGLFPRNHPALKGDQGARLTLFEVIRIARSNLSFTREGMPQMLVFAAVIGCLGLGVLAVFTLIFSLFIGRAHAAAAGGTYSPCSSSPFQPCDNGAEDIALTWMNYLFSTTQVSDLSYDYLTPFSQKVPIAPFVQQALITSLGYYSDAILIVAAFILFYHLASMIVETAHHGVVMGKRANQIWAPIRLVVAIGLLVPISSGLNAGQYIVVQIAEWGSNLASETWSVFLQALVNENNNPATVTAPYVRSLIGDAAMMEGCTYAYNGYSTSQATALGGTTSAVTITDPPSPVPNPVDSTSSKYSYQPPIPPGMSTEQDVCGYFVTPGSPVANNPNPTAYEQQLAAAQTAVTSAFVSTLSSVQQYAGKAGIGQFMPPSATGTSDQPVQPNTGFETLVNGFQTQVQTQITNLTQSQSGYMQQIATTSSDQGWVSAGAWFNTIARMEGEISDVAHDLLPVATPPDVKNISGRFEPSTPAYEALAVMPPFENWLRMEDPSSFNGSPSQGGQLALAAADQVAGSSNNSSDGHFMDKIFELVDALAQMNGVWQAPNSQISNGPQYFTLGVQFTSANPLAEIAVLGHDNINTAYDLLDISFALMGMSGTGGLAKAIQDLSAVAGGAGGLLSGILAGIARGGAAAAGTLGSVLGTISIVFFTAGFMLAYFLPLIPFMKFLFGILSWFLSLLESIIAVPLIALAHLNPGGEGLPGDNGKTAYYFVFNLFLRPVLMVFGLICGLLLFYLAASAMNLMYLVAVVGTGGVSHGHITLARIVYSILYVVLLYFSANNVFKLIDWLPEHCIKWMGTQGLHHAPMGDPTDIAGYMGAAAGYVDQQIVGGASKLMGTPAGTVVMGGMLKDNPGMEKNIQDKMGGLLAKTGASPALIAGAHTFMSTGMSLEKGASSAASAASGFIAKHGPTLEKYGSDAMQDAKKVGAEAAKAWHDLGPEGQAAANAQLHPPPPTEQ